MGSERQMRSTIQSVTLIVFALFFQVLGPPSYGRMYETPPSPLLRNHRLLFAAPPGWSLAKVTQDKKPLKVSQTGQIQARPFWDVEGIRCYFKKAASKQVIPIDLLIIPAWYPEVNGLPSFLPNRVPFKSASGLEGWLSSASLKHRVFMDYAGYFACLLYLYVPSSQSELISLDRTYSTVVLLGCHEPDTWPTPIYRPPTASQQALLRLLGHTLGVDPKSFPAPSWLPAFPATRPQGSFYYTPPAGFWLGQQLRLTIPAGWYVAKVVGEHSNGEGPEAALSGWEKNVPDLVVMPQQKIGNSRPKLEISFWVAVGSYQARHSGLGYPFVTPSGLSGFLVANEPSILIATLYIPQVRIGRLYEADVLTVSCQLPQSPKLAAALRPIALALLASVTVVPPSKQTTQPNLPFDPAFLYDIDQPFHPNPLLYAANGRLYASATFHRSQNPGFLFSLSPNGTGFRVLHSFAPLQPDFSNQDGAFPFAPLAQDAHQHLFGTTSTGGPACDGTLFTLAPDGSHFRLLHAFSGPDGALPYAGVLLTQDGWLYGVTEEGGQYGKGVVYRIREDGTGFQVLHSFGGRDGAYPLLVELVEGEGGWLYGVTSGGGVYGNGVVFGVKADGSGYRVLHEFGAEDGLGRNGDGSHPYCGLVLGLGGWLYGVTYGGGVYGAGVVFGVKADGSGYRVLHALKGGVEGSHAVGRLLLLGDKLYGVCSEGGSLGGGCVFVLGLGGEGYRVLHSFGVDREGWTGLGGLVMLGGGWLYGVTEGGGIGGQGVVYRLRADGSGFGVVYEFGKRLKPVPSR